MTIKTEYEVNNLVKHKFQNNIKTELFVLEVMEIITQTCYAGTQVFYLCRGIFAKKEFNDVFDESKGFTWVINHNISNTDMQMGLQKYREDELIPLKEEEINIILGTA